MKYLERLPFYYDDIRDFKELDCIFNSKQTEVDNSIKSVLNNMVVMTCPLEKLTQWENELGISHEERNDLQRRMMIIATIKGAGKLNESKIKTIVRTFSGGGCLVVFTNSAITVKVSPPQWGEIFLFPDVKKALQSLVPAHIGLEVVRYYNTWGNRMNQHATWEALKTKNTNWAEVKNKVEGL